MPSTDVDAEGEEGELQFDLIGLDASYTFVAPTLRARERWLNALNRILVRSTSSAQYIANLCSHVFAMSNNQIKGLRAFRKLSAMGSVTTSRSWPSVNIPRTL